MQAFKVVGVDILLDCFSSLSYVAVTCQICFLILKAAEPSIYHDVIHPSAFSIHTDFNLLGLYKFSVGLSGKLAALIRVEDLWTGNLKSSFI